MKVLFDCDAIIDIWGNTEDFFASYASFDTVLSRRFYPCITVTSLVSISYVLEARKFLNRQAARQAISALLKIFEVLDATASDAAFALESDMADFEDALTAFAAKRHEVDFIVTRNKRDFAKSPVPALTPQEFVGIYKPDCLEYEMVPL